MKSTPDRNTFIGGRYTEFRRFSLCSCQKKCAFEITIFLHVHQLDIFFLIFFERIIRMRWAEKSDDNGIGARGDGNK